MVSCSLDWSQTWSVAKDELNFWSFFLQLPNSEQMSLHTAPCSPSSEGSVFGSRLDYRRNSSPAVRVWAMSLVLSAEFLLSIKKVLDLEWAGLWLFERWVCFCLTGQDHDSQEWEGLACHVFLEFFRRVTIQNHNGQDAADSPGPLDLAFLTVKGEGHTTIQRKPVRLGRAAEVCQE